MKPDLADLIFLSLAVWQAVEVWHHGSIFAGCRQRVECRADWLGSLLLCPWCLSVWVAWLLGAAWLLLPSSWQAVRLFTIGLAVSRLANLGNDLTAAWCRTPAPWSLPSDRPLDEEKHDDTERTDPGH